MTDLTEELIQICRYFAAFEKQQVCCGTVTVPQCVVLQSLLKSPSEGAVLASENGVSRSSMTRLLDGLERKGWVERTRSVDDRRRVGVALTESGQTEAMRLRGLTEDSIGAVLAAIPKGKRAQVAESVALVRAALENSRDKITCC